MKKYYLVTAVICALVLLAASFLFGFWNRSQESGILKVGFMYSEDESTPYTRNFVQAQHLLTEEFGDRVEVLARSNVLSREAEEPMRELIRKGCKILFINLDTDVAPRLAREFPEVTFCQVSLPDISLEGQAENYHTFNGEVYQARYVSGIIAGMKLRELLDSGALLPADAQVGYVAANDSPEVISGCTAFLLGIRSVAPEARMRVRKTGTWSSYSLEKQRATELIQEGCVIISQHTNTMGPAIACENAAKKGQRVYYIGYHQSMMDVAPSTHLVSIRTNWYPYISGAVKAMMKHSAIEETVPGHVHGKDISAGFDQEWVQMLELNKHLAAPGTEEKMLSTIEAFRAGRVDVFRGNYTGISLTDPADVIDLNKGYTEHRDSSSPSFHYILRDYITVEN